MDTPEHNNNEGTAAEEETRIRQPSNNIKEMAA
jgi:hypothetical protein